jgi:hypothetical protein
LEKFMQPDVELIKDMWGIVKFTITSARDYQATSATSSAFVVVTFPQDATWVTPGGTDYLIDCWFGLKKAAKCEEVAGPPYQVKATIPVGVTLKSTPTEITIKIIDPDLTATPVKWGFKPTASPAAIAPGYFQFTVGIHSTAAPTTPIEQFEPWAWIGNKLLDKVTVTSATYASG